MICLNAECEAQDGNECLIPATVKLNEAGICAHWFAQACTDNFPPVIPEGQATQ